MERAAGPSRRTAVLCALLVLAAVVEALATARGVAAVTPVPGRLGPGLSVVLPVLLALATTGLPVAWWRQPVAAAGGGAVAVVVSMTGFGTLTVAGAVTLLVVEFRLGDRLGQQLVGPGRSAAFAAVATALPFLALAAALPGTGRLRVLTVLLASGVPVAQLAGVVRRARRVVREQAAAQEAFAGTLLVHAARGERARIARELHDVVAHHISMVVVQAEAARLATPGLPPSGAQRLVAIGDTARAALTEMRRLLGVLRDDATDATDAGAGPALPAPPAGRRPQPGLRELTELVDTARDATGSGVRLVLRGTPRPLAPGVELAAYRIVQEALTNARRHASGAAVDVDLHYDDGRLRVLVRDNGPGCPAAPPSGGHGLTGMAERAAAVGGRLRSGPGAAGGFLVEFLVDVPQPAPPSGVTAGVTAGATAALDQVGR